jgi:hypothetical protein
MSRRANVRPIRHRQSDWTGGERESVPAPPFRSGFRRDRCFALDAGGFCQHLRKGLSRQASRNTSFMLVSRDICRKMKSTGTASSRGRSHLQRIHRKQVCRLKPAAQARHRRKYDVGAAHLFCETARSSPASATCGDRSRNDFKVQIFRRSAMASASCTGLASGGACWYAMPRTR